ncbi:sensor histidine kinase [Paenibacillus sp. MBLB4367]|uniref:sensor histidine kinase n=1 Tax=Paenibacillus sp. MBLB4367 TaxID=3384767 RepID=UPI003908061A
MKLRSYLLIANGVSMAVVLLCLAFGYMQMALSLRQLAWISGVTIGAGFLSFAVHYMMIRPVERSIRGLMAQTKRIAEGDFLETAPGQGPSEVKLLAGQLNEMSRKLDENFKRLRASEAARRELVANVSHDLRTPMASIQAFVEALQDELAEDKETFARYMHTIRLETGRLNLLIDDLFQLSRLEAGAVAFVPEPYPADKLLLDVLERHALQIEGKRLEIRVEMAEMLPPVLVMPLQIERVLTNLLTNAIRHSPEGGLLRLQVAMGDDRQIRFSLRDEGEGIAPDDMPRLFERFYRSDRSRSRESGGSGLGLSIAKSIVDLHGGKLGAESAPGQGSLFWFTVPPGKNVRHL